MYCETIIKWDNIKQSLCVKVLEDSKELLSITSIQFFYHLNDCLVMYPGETKIIKYLCDVVKEYKNINNATRLKILDSLQDVAKYKRIN